MPTYVYACKSCASCWDVVKRVANIDDPEPCASCSTPGERRIQAPALDRSAASDWNTPHFNPALGQVVNSNKHAQKIAKAKGLIEVGNEKPETIHKYFDEKRETAKKERWEKADREMQYE